MLKAIGIFSLIIIKDRAFFYWNAVVLVQPLHSPTDWLGHCTNSVLSAELKDQQDNSRNITANLSYKMPIEKIKDQNAGHMYITEVR